MFTQQRFRLKTSTFLCVCTFCLHEKLKTAENGTENAMKRKRSGNLKNKTSINNNLPCVNAENDSLKVWLLIIEVGVDCTKMAEKELMVLAMLLCCLLVLQQTTLL